MAYQDRAAYHYNDQGRYVGVQPPPTPQNFGNSLLPLPVPRTVRGRPQPIGGDVVYRNFDYNTKPAAPQQQSAVGAYYPATAEPNMGYSQAEMPPTDNRPPPFDYGHSAPYVQPTQPPTQHHQEYYPHVPTPEVLQQQPPAYQGQNNSYYPPQQDTRYPPPQEVAAPNGTAYGSAPNVQKYDSGVWNRPQTHEEQPQQFPNAPKWPTQTQDPVLTESRMSMSTPRLNDYQSVLPMTNSDRFQGYYTTNVTATLAHQLPSSDPNQGHYPTSQTVHGHFSHDGHNQQQPLMNEHPSRGHFSNDSGYTSHSATPIRIAPPQAIPPAAAAHYPINGQNVFRNAPPREDGRKVAETSDGDGWEDDDSKTKVFTGVVTQIQDNFGMIGDDVFFQKSAVKGPCPKVGDRVLVEAEAVSAMPFKWNSKRVQSVNQNANTQDFRSAWSQSHHKEDATQFKITAPPPPCLSATKPLKSILKGRNAPPPPMISKNFASPSQPIHHGPSSNFEKYRPDTPEPVGFRSEASFQHGNVNSRAIYNSGAVAVEGDRDRPPRMAPPLEKDGGGNRNDAYFRVAPPNPMAAVEVGVVRRSSRSPEIGRRSLEYNRRSPPDLPKTTLDSRMRSPEYRGRSPLKRLHSPDARRRSPDGRRRSADTRRRSPEMRRRSPVLRRISPETRGRSPEVRRRSPEGRRKSPEVRRRSPALRRISPEVRRKSPALRRISPEMRRRSPEMRRRSPALRRISPEVTSRSPEPRRRLPDTSRRSPDIGRRSPRLRSRSPIARRNSPTPGNRRTSLDTKSRVPSKSSISIPNEVLPNLYVKSSASQPANEAASSKEISFVTKKPKSKPTPISFPIKSVANKPPKMNEAKVPLLPNPAYNSNTVDRPTAPPAIPTVLPNPLHFYNVMDYIKEVNTLSPLNSKSQQPPPPGEDIPISIKFSAPPEASSNQPPPPGVEPLPPVSVSTIKVSTSVAAPKAPKPQIFVVNPLKKDQTISVGEKIVSPQFFPTKETDNTVKSSTLSILPLEKPATTLKPVEDSTPAPNSVLIKPLKKKATEDGTQESAYVVRSTPLTESQQLKAVSTVVIPKLNTQELSVQVDKALSELRKKFESDKLASQQQQKAKETSVETESKVKVGVVEITGAKVQVNSEIETKLLRDIQRPVRVALPVRKNEEDAAEEAKQQRFLEEEQRLINRGDWEKVATLREEEDQRLRFKEESRLRNLRGEEARLIRSGVPQQDIDAFRGVHGSFEERWAEEQRLSKIREEEERAAREFRFADNSQKREMEEKNRRRRMLLEQEKEKRRQEYRQKMQLSKERETRGRDVVFRYRDPVREISTSPPTRNLQQQRGRSVLNDAYPNHSQGVRRHYLSGSRSPPHRMNSGESQWTTHIMRRQSQSPPAPHWQRRRQSASPPPGRRVYEISPRQGSMSPPRGGRQFSGSPPRRGISPQHVRRTIPTSVSPPTWGRRMSESPPPMRRGRSRSGGSPPIPRWGGRHISGSPPPRQVYQKSRRVSYEAYLRRRLARSSRSRSRELEYEEFVERQRDNDIVVSVENHHPPHHRLVHRQQHPPEENEEVAIAQALAMVRQRQAELDMREREIEQRLGDATRRVKQHDTIGGNIGGHPPQRYKR